MKKILPETPIPMGDNLTVGDFWSWAYSDILSNANRGVFAEFLIGTALEAVKNCRVEWDGYDLDYRGYGIEVKSAAYLQSWHQEKLSTIRFDIAERSSSWDPKTNAYHQEKKRYADCYAFCHYAQTDPDKADVLDIPTWDFYVVPTTLLNSKYGSQKSIGLKPLQKICEPVNYTEIKQTVDTVLGIE